MAKPTANEWLQVERIGESVVVRLNRANLFGEENRELMRQHLLRLVDDIPERRLWLDFGRVEFIEGGVLSLLIILQRRMEVSGHRLLVTNLSPTLQVSMEATRLDLILDLRAGLPEDPPPEPMPSEQGFLDAICDDPEDVTVRLIYADWLEERDDPRGEFIRLQMELSQSPPYDARQIDLRRRERELLARYDREWARPIRSRVTSWSFRRGFIERVTLAAPAFVDQRGVLGRLAPIRDIQLRPGWPRTPGLVEALLTWPHLAMLERLDLRYCVLGDAGISQLAASASPHRLRALDLRSNDIRDAGAMALAQSSSLSNLTSLDLRGNVHIGDAARNLLRSRFGSGLML